MRSRNLIQTTNNPLILDMKMDQDLLDEQHILLGTLSVIKHHCRSGNFDIPYLVNELQKFTTSLSEYFSTETEYIKSIIRNPDCPAETVSYGEKLFAESDHVMDRLGKFVRDHWGSNRNREISFNDFQIEMMDILSMTEERLNGKKGEDTPFFHLQNPLF